VPRIRPSRSEVPGLEALATTPSSFFSLCFCVRNRFRFCRVQLGDPRKFAEYNSAIPGDHVECDSAIPAGHAAYKSAIPVGHVEYNSALPGGGGECGTVATVPFSRRARGVLRALFTSCLHGEKNRAPPLRPDIWPRFSLIQIALLSCSLAVIGVICAFSAFGPLTF
jgi:hypothetical protein